MLMSLKESRELGEHEETQEEEGEEEVSNLNSTPEAVEFSASARECSNIRSQHPQQSSKLGCKLDVQPNFHAIDSNSTIDGDFKNLSDEKASPKKSAVAGTGSASTTNTACPQPSGYYDADKCRAHIANRIKVSKIDRFAAQISKAIEVEAQFQLRLANVLNMFQKKSSQVTYEFTLKCKLGLQRHRQDRILNQQRQRASSTKQDAAKIARRVTKKRNYKPPSDVNHKHYPTRTASGLGKHYSISNDLLYGPGAQMVHLLLSHQTMPTFHTPGKRKKPPQSTATAIVRFKEEPPEHDGRIGGQTSKGAPISEDDYKDLVDSFEPSKFVKQLGDCLRNNVQKSSAITMQLNTLRQSFERLASEHHDKVDLVYAAEEERQAATVVRRSAYNLSVAAIKATSTPVHVNITYNNGD